MKKLNKREKESLKVIVDLYLKGTPEYRIAKYLHQRKFTMEQAIAFLDKLPEELFVDKTSKICVRIHLRAILQERKPNDLAESTGERLSHWANRHA